MTQALTSPQRTPATLLHDRQFVLAVIAGMLVLGALWLWLQPGHQQPWHAPWPLVQLALFYPILEEIVFRGMLQGWLERHIRAHAGPLSGANLITSIVFTLAHLFAHSPLWALAVFLPSLLFGYFRERYNHLLPPILLHVLYNSGYFLLFGMGRG